MKIFIKICLLISVAAKPAFAEKVPANAKDQEQVLELAKAISLNDINFKLLHSLERELLAQGFQKEQQVMQRYLDEKFKDLNFEELVRDVEIAGKEANPRSVQVVFLQIFKKESVRMNEYQSTPETYVYLSIPIEVDLDRTPTQNGEIVIVPRIKKVEAIPQFFNTGGPKGTSSSSGGGK